MTRADLIARVYRAHLPSFTRLAFRELHPHRPFHDTWHIDVLADALARCLKGQTPRLVVNLPPRSLASHCACVALPVFALGRDPTRSIVVVTGTRDQASELRDRAVTLMQAPRCRSLSPHLRPTERRGGLALAHGGGIVWGVAGHSRIARGADLIILDVPLAPARALDDAARRRVNAWYDAEVAPRLAGQEAAVVLLSPRLHRDDLTGHVLQQDGWARMRDAVWRITRR